MPEIICRRCKKPFYAKPSANAVYCSRECRKSRVTKICKACQKPFQVRGKFRHRIYCSRKCYLAARDDLFQESRITKSCKRCGETFEVALSRAKKKAYCSSRCRGLGVKEEQAEKRVNVVCEYCRREYSLPQCLKRRRNYCSKKCKHGDGKITFGCFHCGRVITVKRHEVIGGRGRRFCSTECGLAWRREQGLPVGRPFCLGKTLAGAAKRLKRNKSDLVRDWLARQQDQEAVRRMTSTEIMGILKKEYNEDVSQLIVNVQRRLSGLAPGAPVYDVEAVQEIFQKQSCRLLESAYRDCKTPMRYICACGATARITLEHFLRGQRCQACKKKRIGAALRHSDAYVKRFFADHGCTVLDRYENSKTPMRYICECGQESRITFHDFRSGCRCKDCGIRKRKTLDRARRKQR